MIETGSLVHDNERLRQLLAQHMIGGAVQTSADQTLDDDTWLFDTDHGGVMYLSPRNHAETAHAVVRQNTN